MRIAIVNDTVMAVEVLRRIVTSASYYKIAWIAHNGSQAIAKCAVDPPDLILMDMIMPDVDGVEATRMIMKQSPCAILIVTANVQQNSAKVFEAMGYGALDAVNTPPLGTSGLGEVSQTLLNKIATIGVLIGKRRSKHTHTSDVSSPGGGTTLSKVSHPPRNIPFLIILGASTGGPKALGTILSELPANFTAAIVIIQHVDSQFAPGLAKWLNQQGSLTVRLAVEGDQLVPGTVLLAGTNDHLVLRPNLTLTYTKKPQDNPYRPSVDVFCESVAQYWSRKGIAVLLTGMGRDGATGLGVLRSRGWHTIAQDRSSCVVYGMPKAAVEMDSAMEVLPLLEIAPTLIKKVIHTS
ncbi:chemotaxis response regulator protein-glutamate methylesterase [Aphanothece sacrum]|uniref:Protein-glutamate methylesterase/protein-glutamine glutaminase n=1 Tax=Aphanothece sacrum FPU1 TaxID=1920663 RepID=A0A401IKV0_APHSA|nr:chemotaxis response regulator protein-glutamate methylesterase [Aphanothece sacrum]GBF81879.1 two-component response regulator [Aphanothece sacrum FPU1]GBF83508.1 glutamate methylesterase [Aphanothece sacrum FPU3]